METKGTKSDGATHLAAPSRKWYLARGVEGYRGADLKNDLPARRPRFGHDTLIGTDKTKIETDETKIGSDHCVDLSMIPAMNQHQQRIISELQ